MSNARNQHKKNAHGRINRGAGNLLGSPLEGDMEYTVSKEEHLTAPIYYARRLLKETKKPIRIVIVKKKKRRSLNQNSYYWGVVLKVIGDELGYFPEEMHQCLATMFLKRIIKIGEECIETYRSTAKLKTGEFEDYLQKIRIFASSELGIFVPLPNEIIDEEND